MRMAVGLLWLTAVGEGFVVLLNVRLPAGHQHHEFVNIENF